MTINSCIVKLATVSAGSGGVADTDATTSVDNTVGGVTLRAAATTPMYFFCQNRGATKLYLSTDGTAATTTDGIEILPGDHYERVWPAVPTAEILAIRAGAGEDVIVVTA